METNKSTCPMCQTDFGTKGLLHKHQRNKHPCITPKRCLELINEINLKTQELNKSHSQTKEHKDVLEQQRREIDHLKSLLIKTEEIKKSIDKLGEKIDEKQVANTVFNNNINNHNNINNDNKMLVAIDFSEKGKVNLNHITPAQTMQILDCKDFNNSLKYFTQVVFFNPKAPENQTWCVVDKNAQWGALEYNPESNSAVRRQTVDVITSNMTELIFQASDYFSPCNEEYGRRFVQRRPPTEINA